MPLNFKVGDRVQAQLGYITDPQSGLPTRTAQRLTSLGLTQAIVTEIGYIKVEDQITSQPLPIRIYPVNPNNPLYQNGQGTVLHFKTETQINNALVKA